MRGQSGYRGDGTIRVRASGPGGGVWWHVRATETHFVVGDLVRGGGAPVVEVRVGTAPTALHQGKRPVEVVRGTGHPQALSRAAWRARAGCGGGLPPHPASERPGDVVHLGMPPGWAGKGAGQGPERVGRSGRRRHSSRYQSAMFHSSLSQVFRTTPPRLFDFADTRPRCTSGTMVIVSAVRMSLSSLAIR